MLYFKNMDKDIAEARKMAIDALASAIGFWGVDPLEARVYGALFLSQRALGCEELSVELGSASEEVCRKFRLLERLGAVKEKEGGYEAEADFFEILQAVLRERQEREMGKALKTISEQKEFVEERYEDEGDPELEFLAGRLDRLDRFIKLIDKAMFGLKTLAGIRGFFKGR